MTQEETDELINLFFNPTLKKENEELKERIHDLLLDNTEYKLENERLNKQYDLMENSLDEKQEVIDKAIKFIKENCIKSDKWEDLGFCNLVPTGKISYNSLSVKKVKELLNILKGEE